LGAPPAFAFTSPRVSEPRPGLADGIARLAQRSGLSVPDDWFFAASLSPLIIGRAAA